MKVITIASAKGGVGKTTVTVNLAYALNQLGEDVIILDANITAPNIYLHLGIPKMKNTLHDVLQGKISLRKAVYLLQSGVKIVSTGISVRDLTRKSKVKLEEAIKDLKAYGGTLLVDSSPGLGSEAKMALNVADEVLIVTTPELPSVVDALCIREYCRSIGKEVIGVVINRFSGKKHEMSISNIEAFLEAKVLSVIPEDERIKIAISLRRPVVEIFPNAPSSMAIKKLASKIIGKEYYEIAEKNILKRITHKLKRIFKKK